MLPPNCPDHGSLMLDLAQGRLEEHAALEAEELLTSCPSCRTWWAEQLEGEAATVVDAAVAEAFDSFAAPRKRLPVWLPAAAALAAAVGVAVLWQTGAPAPTAEDLAATGTPLVELSFEDPDALFQGADAELSFHQEGSATSSPGTPRPTDTRPSLIFSDSLEDGDLSAWTVSS